MKKHTAYALLACFTMLSTSAWAQDSEEQKADLRLALDKVNLYAQTDKLDQAFSLINQLKNEYPNNSQVLQAEADLNLRVGNRGAAFAQLSKAVNLDPNNEDVLSRQRALILDQGPFAAAGYRFRSTKAANEHFAHFSGQAALSQSLSVGIDVEDDHLNSKGSITRVNGSAERFNDDRQHGTLTLGKMYDNGNEAGAFLYANNYTPGAGVRYSWWDYQGATTALVNLHKPDWDYVESVIQDGTKDNVHLERKQLITNHLQVTLGGGYNRYNLHNDTDVAGAAAWDLNVAYTHPYSFSGKTSDEVMLGAYYTVDAEYFTHVDRRTVASVNFAPLPASSYEIHSVNLSMSKTLSSQVYAEAYGGYGIDRLGSNGPLFGGAVEYAPMDHLGIELRGSRTLLGGEHNSEKEDQIGLNVKWRW